MKNLKLKSFFLALLLTCGVGQMQAWELWGNFYFSNYSKEWDDVSLCIGDDKGSAGYHFTKLDHTQLWYRWLTIDSYGDVYFFNGNWNDENFWNGYDYRPYGRTYYLSNDNKWQPYKDDYKENKPGGPGKRYYFDGVNNSSKAGYLPTYMAYLRVKIDEEADGTYPGCLSGETEWGHGLTFDFTGTYMSTDAATAQSTIEGLEKNYWLVGETKTWGYGGIPVTGEVTFELKTIDTGFELAGWAYSESATSPAYTPEDPTDVTFQVLGNTSYVAFIRRKSYTVTLNDNGGSGGSGSKTVAYDLSTNMTTSVSVPSKTGYAFQGYYTNPDGTGSMVINASGVWQKNVTDYTGTDGSSNPKWVRDGGVTLYAKWTQTVTLHDNHGGSNNGSISAIYNGVMSGKVVPTYTDHTLDLGYYAESGCSNMVMNLDGSLIASLTVSETKWTSGSKWIHDGSSTIYAHWKVNAPGSISCTDNVVTIAVPTDATVHYTIDGSDPTSSSATYDPTNKPVIASSGITVKAIAVQSGCTNSEVTSQAVTYTPVYTVTHTITNVTKSSGETSVLENKAYTALYTDATGYDLPSTISVTVGGSPLTLTTDYTWSVSDGTGTLSIQANKITGNVVITIVGDAETYDGDIEGVDGSDGAYTATYGATTIDVTTEPARSGYHVVGYFLSYALETYSLPIADASGNLITSATDGVHTYTNSSNEWTYTGDAPTIYAKWAVDTYTLTLHENIPSGTTGIAGTGSVEVTYNDVDYTPDELTLPRAEGYTFAGYYTAAVGGAQIYTNEGSIHTSATDGVTNYTSNVAKWIYAGDVDLYAHWTDNGTYVFKGGASDNETSWSTAANWTKGVAPSANDGSEDIIILAPVEIPASATTNVNSVRIGTVGSYTPVGGSAIAAAGKLTIPATAMLKVTTNVQNYDFSTPSASPTTESTLHIESASTGNGALVWGTSGTPGEAQVDFYTKSGGSVNSTASINQYIGTPFSDANVLYNYYNAWTFKVNDAGTAWERLKGNETMSPFVGYNVIYDGAVGHIFEMDGTLVTNANKTCTLSHTTDGEENLLANSWTAPMWIKGFANDDFTNADASIYIFNSTSEDDSEEDVSVGGGNYTPYTSGTSGDDAYIPSMQSFSVLSSGGAGSVTLNYTNLVLNPASHSHIAPMHAPSRFADGETEPEENLEPKMDFLRLRVADTNGWADELKIYIREDFVEEFENGFDARKMYGDDRAPMLYGISPDGRMAINCIPTADNHVVGFHGGSASNEYTFRFAYDGEEELYLRDNKTGAETLISAEDTYSFTTEAGDNDLRFSIIRKTPAVPTDIETVTGEGLQTTGVQKIMYNGMLYILRSGRIYDATGALVK